MHSPTSSEDSRLVRIVVPCVQTRLPGPTAHKDAFSSSSERCQRRTFRQACSAGHRASFDVLTPLERCHYTVSLISYSWPAVMGCGLYLRVCAVRTGTRLYYSMLLVVFSHIIP